MTGPQSPMRGIPINPALREAAMRGEPDRYLAATLAPRTIRGPLAAIAAFAAEIGRIPSSVSEPMLGSVRLQWWRDALAKACQSGGQRTGHPVADAFAATAVRYGIDAGWIEAVLEAREFDLSGGLQSDDRGWQAYLDATEGHVFRMAFAVAGLDRKAGDALSLQAGCAYGLARALARLPMLLHNGGLPLPSDRLKAAGVATDALADVPVTLATRAGVASVVRDLQRVARTSLEQLRDQADAIDRRGRCVLLPLAMVEPYFRAQTPGVDLERMIDVSPLQRVARIGLAYLSGRF